jgi:tRNA-dihydrouridine synthase
MRAATCRCGHVGAECFNDSYCEDAPIESDLEARCNSLDSMLANANDEIQAMKEAHKVAQYKQYEGTEFWRKAYERQSEVFTRVEVDLQNRITELLSHLETTPAQLSAEYWQEIYNEAMEHIARRNDMINDLQADYASDIQAWRNVYQANESVNDDVIQEQADRIIELESTVKVLAGMINNE